jgi:hypothetical protein
VIARVHARKRVQERNRADLEGVVAVLLLAFAQEAEGGGEGYIDLSLDAIRDSIRARDPDSTIDRSTAGRLLKRVKEGDDACGFALVREIRRNRDGQNPAGRYRPGADLRATEWGAALPQDAEEDAPPPRTEPITMRVFGLGGRSVEVFPPPKPRGRPRKGAENAAAAAEEQAEPPGEGEAPPP